jgi:hypothetical protein
VLLVQVEFYREGGIDLDIVAQKGVHCWDLLELYKHCFCAAALHDAMPRSSVLLWELVTVCLPVTVLLVAQWQ